jgi:hypothetical protein
VSPRVDSQSQEIQATFKRGRMRLETAGQNQSMLEQSLLSFHGALEDYFRFFLSEHSDVPAETRAMVRDRSKTQWRDLANLAQKYHLIDVEDKYLILGMNKKRQEIAHGKSCKINKKEVEHYAERIQSIIGYTNPTSSNVSTIQSIPIIPPVVTDNPVRTSSSYTIAVIVASIILVVMVVSVLFMIIPSKNTTIAPSLRTVTTNSDCVIKGNISITTGNRYYHLPGMEDYDSTVITLSKGERWFCTEAEAIAQGWRKASK